MKGTRFIALAALSLTTALLPLAGTAATQPSPEQVKAAIKQGLMNADLTMRQKIQIKGMMKNYQEQTANADEATKQADGKALIKNIYGVLTPQQQTAFKASVKQSLGGSMP